MGAPKGGIFHLLSSILISSVFSNVFVGDSHCSYQVFYFL